MCTLMVVEVSIIGSKCEILGVILLGDVPRYSLMDTVLIQWIETV